MATSSSTPQSRPRRAPRIQYAEVDSDSVDFSEIETRPQPPRRSRRQIPTYRESSDDDSDLQSDSSIEVQPQQGTKSRPRIQETASLASRKRKAAPLRKAAVGNSFSAYKRQKTGSSTLPRKQDAQVSIIIPPPPSGRAPPWQELPYHVLVSVMKHAAYPLYGQVSQPTASLPWLLSMSTLCRSFHEACMAALLHNPPLYPAWRAHGLIELLKQEPEDLMTDYRAKIHYLEIEVKQLLYKKAGISLMDLLTRTPLLQGLRLYSNYDDMQTSLWAQPAAQRRMNWSYPTEMFDHFDRENIFMLTFEWNGRFPNPKEALQTALSAHSRPAFSRLREVSFLNLTLPEKTTNDDVATARSLFTGALTDLVELKHLTLKNCGILDEVTAPLLPIGLEYLEVVQCSQLTSPALAQYLAAGGSTLRTMKLIGCQSLSLGFMAELKTLCPRLEDFVVDMFFIDPTSFADREPLFLALLPDGPPTWPASLVNLSLENIRHKVANEAHEFLESLVESSEQLPRLKRINIKMILKLAGWRDRAQLRKDWLPKLQEVFLNTDKPLDQWEKASKQSSQSSQRQSSRLATKGQSTAENTDDSDAGPAVVVQGRCDVVNLVISDQRPAQDQFREDDFLDDEPSDDEEWNGRDQQPRSSGYAW
ncbi:hypothetical protein EDD37DRAFT_630654 [Exophiala viscosa]|uniref:Uncharacterized protein n=1 Tax=Exophiala viscosa TaxID=2486360 RepID=A0AAN6E0J8_9EURO|nr:hypothetical protein EDD36DRAFT_431428 [Exophiala viscosa]KAI1624284.1 hypothetical protein EDD37DRAFT_630654 [Exophiala viscosa]